LVEAEKLVDGKAIVQPLGRLLRVTGDFIEVENEKDDVMGNSQMSTTGTLKTSAKANEIAIERRKKAIEKVNRGTAILPNLRELISEKDFVQPIQVYRHKFPSIQVPTLLNGHDPDLKQQKAVEMALNTDDICLIQGPPGTGKTAVIQTIIKSLISMGKDKIMLTSYQHLAVDNAMEGLVKSGILTYRYGGKGHEVQTEREYAAFISDIIRSIEETTTSGPVLKDEETITAETVKEQLLQWISKNEINDEDLEKMSEIVSSLEHYALNHMDVYSPMQELTFSLSLMKNRPQTSLNQMDLEKIKKLIDEVPVSLEECKSKSQFIKWEHLLGALKELIVQSNTYFHEIVVITATLNKLSKDRRRVLLLDDKEDKVKEYIKTLKRIHQDCITLCEYLSEQVIIDEDNYTFPFIEAKEQMIHLIQTLDASFHTTENDEFTEIDRIQAEWIRKIKGNPLSMMEVVRKYAQLDGVTCQQAMAGRHSLYETVFDAVIVDEAARANPLDLLIPITMGKKVILVGDHRQLPHILEHEFENSFVDDEFNQDDFDEVFKKSLFERLFTLLPLSKKVMLNKQFRMHPVIGDLISQLFYPESLEHGNKNGLKNDTGLYDKKNIAWIDIPFNPLKRYSEERKYINKCEADVIINEIGRLIKDNAHYSIGIITFYAEQSNYLKKLIYNHGYENIVEVGTVDSFQGKEKDIVFLSAVRSNSFKEMKRSLGFLAFPNRLNVAISRAKMLLVIVGDYSTLKKHPLFESMYEYVKEKGYVSKFSS
jgi:superfamily I DNA/RNA helicase